MESERPPCPGCGVSVHLSEEEIEALFGKMRVTSARLADEAQYRQRMELCGSCDALLYGTTCRFCGCIITIKAKLAGSYCPHPDGPLWEKTQGIHTALK